MWDFIFSWTLVWWIMMLLYIPACLGLILIVLLQKGKGVGFAGAFGAGGGTDAVFGPRSSRSMPQKITYTMAGTFMVLALLMSIISGKVGKGAAPDLVNEAPGIQSSETVDELFDETAVDSLMDETSESGVTPVIVDEATPAAPAADAAATPEVVEAESAPEVMEEAPVVETAPVVIEEAPATEAAPVEAAPEEGAPAAQ